MYKRTTDKMLEINWETVQSLEGEKIDCCIQFLYSQKLSFTPQLQIKYETSFRKASTSSHSRGLQAFCNSSNKSTKITANRVNLNHLTSEHEEKIGLSRWVGPTCFDGNPQLKKVSL